MILDRRWWRKDFPQDTVQVDYKTAVVTMCVRKPSDHEVNGAEEPAPEWTDRPAHPHTEALQVKGKRRTLSVQ